MTLSNVEPLLGQQPMSTGARSRQTRELLPCAECADIEDILIHAFFV